MSNTPNPIVNPDVRRLRHLEATLGINHPDTLALRKTLLDAAARSANGQILSRPAANPTTRAR